MPTEPSSNGISSTHRERSREDLMDMIEDRDGLISFYKAALESIEAMTKENEHDLFSATAVQLARFA